MPCTARSAHQRYVFSPTPSEYTAKARANRLRFARLKEFNNSDKSTLYSSQVIKVRLKATLATSARTFLLKASVPYLSPRLRTEFPHSDPTDSHNLPAKITCKPKSLSTGIRHRILSRTIRNLVINKLQGTYFNKGRRSGNPARTYAK